MSEDEGKTAVDAPVEEVARGDWEMKQSGSQMKRRFKLPLRACSNSCIDGTHDVTVDHSRYDEHRPAVAPEFSRIATSEAGIALDLLPPDGGHMFCPYIPWNLIYSIYSGLAS